MPSASRNGPSANGVRDSILQDSIDSLNNMSIDGNSFMGGSFSKDNATMPPRFSTNNVGSHVSRSQRAKPSSLSLAGLGGSRGDGFVFDLGVMLSPGAEQLARISELFKSGLISNAQRGQMKDQLYMRMSQESVQ